MALAVSAWRDSRARSVRIQPSSAAINGLIRCCRTACRCLGAVPLISGSPKPRLLFNASTPCATGADGAGRLTTSITRIDDLEIEVEANRLHLLLDDARGTPVDRHREPT